MKKGKHYFRIRMTDVYGNQYTGKTVPFEIDNEKTSLRWLSGNRGALSGQIMIRTSQFPGIWKYEMISETGQVILQDKIELREEQTMIRLDRRRFSAGIYIFRAFDSAGNMQSLKFKTD